MKLLAHIRSIAILATGAALAPGVAAAQTDYYNLDKGRPFHVEDAYPVERRAFEIQAAPVRLQRAPGGIYHWSVEPEVAFGVLPRTQVELGVPLVHVDRGAGGTSGARALDLGVLYNFNTETRIPALALAVDAALPVGGIAMDNALLTGTGIATRTLTGMRVHLNGSVTAGNPMDDPNAPLPHGSDELSRWSAGVAVDRTIPLRSILVGAELVLTEPIRRAEERHLSAAVGARYQLAPRWAIDVGAGRQVTRAAAAWSLTFGSAYALGLGWRP
jgi:hypothetical protein